MTTYFMISSYAFNSDVSETRMNKSLYGHVSLINKRIRFFLTFTNTGTFTYTIVKIIFLYAYDID